MIIYYLIQNVGDIMIRKCRLGTKERAEGRTRKRVENPRSFAKSVTKCRSGRVPCGPPGRNSAVLGSEVNRGQGISAT